MSMLSFCLGKLRRRTSAADDAGKPASSGPAVACDSPKECERPISCSELIAASAFLDFGDLFDEQWLAGRVRKETGAGPPAK